MELLLNNILNLTDKQINNSKIEFNMNIGKGGKPFIDRWLKCSEVERISGTCKCCSFWSWYSSKQRNFSVGQWAFSFLRIGEDEWLLISAGEIINTPKNDWATYKVLDQYKPFFGRLVIRCKKGNKFSRYVFNLGKYIETAVVKEILPCVYSGEIFEGYDKVHLPYHRLADIFAGKILPTYYEALKKVIGVYCLTDTFTGKLYIGSATGENGVAQRWGNYLASKHGGNKKLIDLYNKEGKEYFETNFTFTILEYFGQSYNPIKVIEREQYWKHCLDTIKNGYNDN